MPYSFVARLLTSTAFVAWTVSMASAQAQSPQGATVAAGSASVTRQGATTIVTQSTERGIIDWRSFSIGANEAARFDQPGRSSVTLNRVTGAEISRIDGALSSNGQVWLANPNGVMIGPSGQVNVGGLLATTGRIDAAEFLKSGRAAIDRISKDAAIVNAGTVSIAEGGYAALAAASIRNEGVVAARKGSVALGTGKAVTVDFAGDRLITFQVSEALTEAPQGDAMITSGGKIAADGGAVLMSARAAKGVIDNVINLTGHVVAKSVTVDGGTVTFGDGGVTQISGKIDASDASGKGGAVAILGEKVGLMDGARIDASGATGGGTVLVGGDWQGKGPSHNTQIAYVAAGASITADATSAGDGGKVVVWADDTTRFSGTISARGGEAGGVGGQVETSGKRALDVGPTTMVDVGARARGHKPGAWLLDPSDITISDTGLGALVGGVFDPLGVTGEISTATISLGLKTGDVTISTAAGSTGSGDILFTKGAISTTSTDKRILTLLADRDIKISSGASIDLSGAKHDVILNAGAAATAQADVKGGIQIDGGAIKTEGGSIRLVGGKNGDWAAMGSSDLEGRGIYIIGASKLDAGAGTFTAKGRGRDGVVGTYVEGIVLFGASELTANGGLTLIGTSGDGATIEGRGVRINTSTITATGGAVTITGDGGGGGVVSRGVDMLSSTLNFGSATVTVTGKGGSASTADKNYGVNINKSKISGSGDINFSGTGGGAATTSANHGVFMTDAGAAITVTGAGELTITGARGSGLAGININLDGGAIATESGALTLTGTETAGGGKSGYGVRVATGVAVSAVDGAISITGAGAAAGSNDNDGVILVGTGSVKATGLGAITITGARGGFTAGGTPSENINIGSGLVQSKAGAITLLGTADGGGGATAVGVLVQANGKVISESGNIAITGTGAALGTGASAGVSIAGTVSTGGAGAIEITGQATSGKGVSFNKGLVQTDGGQLTLKSPNFNLTGASTVTAGTGPVSLQSADPSGALTIDGALLNTITAGSLTVGKADMTGQITASGALTLKQNLSFASDTGAVVFQGAVDAASAGGQALTVQTKGGQVSFAGSVGGTSALATLNVAGPAKFGGDTVKTTGTQSYAGAVVLAAASTTSFATQDAAVIISGAVNGAGGLAFDVGSGVVTLTGGAGGLTPLASLTVDKAALGGDFFASGAQSFGAVTLLASTNLSAGNGGVAFAGAIDANGGPKSLTVSAGGAGSVAFGGAVGSTGALSLLELTTNGAATALPVLSVTNLAVVTNGGAISQTGALAVSASASFNAGAGGVALTDAANSVGALAIMTSSGADASITLSGGTSLSASNISGALVLEAFGSVSQTGALTASGLLLKGANPTFTLTNPGNAVESLAAALSGTKGAISVGNGSTKALTVGTVAGVAGVTGAAAIALTQTGAGRSITLSGPVSLGSGTASFTADGTVLGTDKISGTSAQVTLAAGASGSSIKIETGNKIVITKRDVTVNGALYTLGVNNVATTDAPEIRVVVAPTSASTPSTASVPSVAGVVSPTTPIVVIPSVTAPIVPPIILPIAPSGSTSIVVSAPLPSVVIAPPPPSVAAPTLLVDAGPTPVFIGAESTAAVLGRILSTLAPAPAPSNSAFENAAASQRNSGPAESDSRQPAASQSASAQRDLVAQTPAGGLIPPSPSSVGFTGAPLTSVRTVKVDAQDSGGPSGQVIAGGAAQEPTKSVVPGIVVEATVTRRPASDEPPLAQQPSTMNEESMLD